MKFQYRGYQVEIEQCGHPQAQNVKIDGKAATVVYFPGDSEAMARKLIDARIAARTESEAV